MKKCSMCKQEKEFNEFNKNISKKDGYQSMCRICWRTYYKENYYLRGREKERLEIKNKKNRELITNYIREVKNIPCMDCGIKYPYYVMDFDHRDSSEKEYAIARMINCGSIEKVKKEINKCDVVCANCHRIRTYS